jgi:hypothetical protein
MGETMTPDEYRKRKRDDIARIMEQTAPQRREREDVERFSSMNERIASLLEDKGCWSTPETGIRVAHLIGTSEAHAATYETTVTVMDMSGQARGYRVNTLFDPEVSARRSRALQLEWTDGEDETTVRRTDPGCGYRDDPRRADKQAETDKANEEHEALRHELRIEYDEALAAGDDEASGGLLLHGWRVSPEWRGEQDLLLAETGLRIGELQRPSRRSKLGGYVLSMFSRRKKD